MHRCRHCKREFKRSLKWQRTYADKEGWFSICGRCANRLERHMNDGGLGSLILRLVQLRAIEPVAKAKPEA